MYLIHRIIGEKSHLLIEQDPQFLTHVKLHVYLFLSIIADWLKSNFIVENITHLFWKFHLHFNHLYYFDSHNNRGYKASPCFYFTVPLALKKEMTHNISNQNIHIIYLAACLPVSHATIKWDFTVI